MSESVTGRRLRSWIRFCGLGIAGSGLLMGVVAVVAGGERLALVSKSIVPFLALGAFWFWGAPAILKAVYRRQFRREAIQEGRDLETVSLGPDGVRPGTKWAHPVPWSEVKRVRETDKLILIEASSDGPTYLPKHALSAEERASLETLLREQFQDRPKDLRMTRNKTQEARNPHLG